MGEAATLPHASGEGLVTEVSRERIKYDLLHSLPGTLHGVLALMRPSREVEPGEDLSGAALPSGSLLTQPLNASQFGDDPEAIDVGW